eukprot:7385619-Prymnesium_polylepis.1
MAPPRCAALTEFAREQLARATPSEVNVSALIANFRRQQAGLVVCVHNGAVRYQESHTRSTWHGEADRAWGALSVVYQWLLRTRWNGTACFQHSGRDDQRQTINPSGRDDGLLLPAMLWHYWQNEQQVAPARAFFLWPEHNYEGEITRGQPPTHAFRMLVASRALPWSERRDRLRFRGSAGISRVRIDILNCAKRPAKAGPARGVADFYRTRTDIDELNWGSTQGRGGNASTADATAMLRFAEFRHALWLPGAFDWSSSLNKLMALGSNLVMPADISQSHSLNSFMLLERCKGCVTTFNRTADNCVALMDAFRGQAEALSENTARRLSAFVGTELSTECVDEYMRVILDGLPQRVHETETMGKLHGFSCREQRDKVHYIARVKGGAGSLSVDAVRNFERWFDEVTCSNAAAAA